MEDRRTNAQNLATSNQTVLGRAHIIATPHGNRHSVVTGAQDVYIGLNFSALRRNWFSQLYFRCSHQSTGPIYKYAEISGICSGSLPKLNKAKEDGRLRSVRDSRRGNTDIGLRRDVRL